MAEVQRCSCEVEVRGPGSLVSRKLAISAALGSVVGLGPCAPLEGAESFAQSGSLRAALREQPGLRASGKERMANNGTDSAKHLGLRTSGRLHSGSGIAAPARHHLAQRARRHLRLASHARSEHA